MTDFTENEVRTFCQEEITDWWEEKFKIVKFRRGSYANMPTLLDGEIFYATDTDEHYGGDEVDGPHLISCIRQGLFSNRPAVGVTDRLYYATDQNCFYLDDGSTWSMATEGSKRKSSDQSLNSNTTLQDDTELYFTIDSDSLHIFELVVFFTTPNAAADIKAGINASAGLDDIRYSIQIMDEDANALENGDIVTASGSGSYADFSSAASSVMYIRGSLDNQSSSNTITFQWAQRVSDGANTIVKKGSYLRWKQVG